MCMDRVTGQRGVVLPSTGCATSNAATGWPRANNAICPAYLPGPVYDVVNPYETDWDLRWPCNRLWSSKRTFVLVMGRDGNLAVYRSTDGVSPASDTPYYKYYIKSAGTNAAPSIILRSDGSWIATNARGVNSFTLGTFNPAVAPADPVANGPFRMVVDDATGVINVQYPSGLNIWSSGQLDWQDQDIFMTELRSNPEKPICPTAIDICASPGIRAPRWTVSRDRRAWGQDYMYKSNVGSPEHCGYLCASTTGCDVWNYRWADGTCELKVYSLTAGKGSSAAPGIDSGLYESADDWDTKRFRCGLYVGMGMCSYLWSRDRTKMLRMEEDGNLCVYATGSSGGRLWCSGTVGPYTSMTLSQDGRLVLNGPEGSTTNMIGTFVHNAQFPVFVGNIRLILTNDGDLNLLNPRGEVIWTSQTTNLGL
ncbi:hypothetical protein HYH03_013638 [Edaphochlamys debaryana]|uniref:Bulb-type lectin domain-containing protein n=1 Tax=Edaphochlamys debaryana TaxID=47281 RepID=A0A836BUD7_9CHLO|nr:hypothetical protein HYH03_013638 [Edaphochlamys debaryana]|eukprot:KAG2487794.1 hypothetical protein HYH03_013638 [Edaphochlamys debaryana]